MIYYTTRGQNSLFQAPVGSSDVSHTSSTLIHSGSAIPDPEMFWALQLGPNDKIYALRQGERFLAVINSPDVTGTGCNYQDYELVVNGNRLEFDNQGVLGLPTFTRISDRCATGTCEALAGEVNEIIDQRFDEIRKPLLMCDDRRYEAEWCEPIDLPNITPQVHVIWSNSNCDHVESNDSEIMLLTVCNPYSNLTIANLTIHKLTLTDANGQPVPTLPDGSASLELVPIGPYCFGEIGPCECIAREFVLRSCGAVEGIYKIRVEGICYDICLHGDDTACFEFEVCKD